MNWKASASVAFVTVLVAEIIAMLTLERLPLLDINSQFAALADGVMLGGCLFLVNTILRRFTQPAHWSSHVDDWQSAAVLFVATVGFETAFHPLSENLSKLNVPIDVEVLDAFITASAVAALSGWLHIVEEQIQAFSPGTSSWTQIVGRPILVGAVISALCVTATAGVREWNDDLKADDAALASDVKWELVEHLRVSQLMGRAALVQAGFGEHEGEFSTVLATADKLGNSLSTHLSDFLRRNRTDYDLFALMPRPELIGGAWQHVLDTSHRFQVSTGRAQKALVHDIHAAVDDFVPLATAAMSSVQAYEKVKATRESSGMGNLFSAIVVFLMALGVLLPLLRLMGAQKSKLSQELRRAEKLNYMLSAYQRGLDNHAIFAITDRMGKITHVNENFCRISGYVSEELLGQNHRLLNSGMHPAGFFVDLWRSIGSGKTWRHEVCNRSKSGSLYWVDTCIMPLAGTDGAPEQFVSISYDITEHKRTEIRAARKVHLESLVDDMRQELFASGAMYSSMSGLLKELNSIIGADASLVCEVGRTVEGMAWSLVLGHFKSRDDHAGSDAPLAVRLLSAETQPALIQDVFQQDGLFGGLSSRQLGADGFTSIPINVGYEPAGVLLVSEGVRTEHFAEEIQLVVAALGDMISARRESDRRRNEEEKARKQAKRDPLTGLGNRRDLAEQFDARIDHPDAKFSLLLVDLDRFKPINDTYGHLIGDTVLRVVAERLRACARGDVTVARIGGDEFAILTEAHADEDEAGALELARSILKDLLAPIECGGHSIQVGASVGVALYPRDGTVFQELLHRADAAMYRAKGNRSEAQVFNASMDEAIRFRGELEADLKRAIDAEEVKPYFQPYVDLRTGKVAGHEVLARWRHAQRGFVSPTEFIKIAEESGLVDKLFWQFLRSACEQHLRHKLTTVLSINLSPTQIKNPTFAKQLVEELERLGFPPHLLEVEITETSMIGDVDRAKPLLLLLRSQGIRIALDDFGTGYSSLALLRHMPINKVKIDRSFISDVEGSEGTGVTIVNAILGMAKALKLQVTAEGIETVEVSEFLRDMGCEYGQGYLFGRAEPEPVTDSIQPDNVHRLQRVAGSRL